MLRGYVEYNLGISNREYCYLTKQIGHINLGVEQQSGLLARSEIPSPSAAPTDGSGRCWRWFAAVEAELWKITSGRADIQFRSRMSCHRLFSPIKRAKRRSPIGLPLAGTYRDVY